MNSLVRWTGQGLGLLMVLILSAPVLQTADASLPTKIQPPARGIYLGAFVDPDANWSGVLKQEAEVTTFEKHIGRHLDIDHHFYGWTGSSQMFPAAFDHWDARHGRIPLISWSGTKLDAILSGAYDSSIRARARAVPGPDPGSTSGGRLAPRRSRACSRTRLPARSV